jgi:hypothetical protein
LSAVPGWRLRDQDDLSAGVAFLDLAVGILDCIGDLTPGLRRDADGSLTIVIQHDQPADSSTWLPARPRRSGPSCACTSRRPPSWTGTYRIPPIVKAGS